MATNPDIHAIRDALRHHMRHRNLGGRALARKADLGESAVRDLLTTVKDPRISTLYALANALEVSIAALLSGTIPEPSSEAE